MLAAKEEIFHGYRLPTVCDMTSYSQYEGFKMYRLMVRSPNSCWLEWLATTGVKELKLPMSMTDEEMLIMFGATGAAVTEPLMGGGGGGGGGGGKGGEGEGGKRFSKLRTLNLRGCENITDARVSEVARRCSNLQTLNLTCCKNITDASVMEVARRCSNLHTLNLKECENITDASVLEVARRCSNLQTLTLLGCSITSACKNALRQSHPKLELNNR